MAARTIALFPQNVNELVREAPAAEILTPGDLCNFATDGDIQKHPTAAINAAPTFAIEQDYTGDTIDTNYAAGELVKYITFPPGSRVRAWLPANADAVVIGDFMESAGAGSIRKHVAPANLSAAAPAYKAIVGRAVQAVDNSASATRVRITIEIV